MYKFNTLCEAKPFCFLIKSSKNKNFVPYWAASFTNALLKRSWFDITNTFYLCIYLIRILFFSQSLHMNRTNFFFYENQIDLRSTQFIITKQYLKKTERNIFKASFPIRIGTMWWITALTVSKRGSLCRNNGYSVRLITHTYTDLNIYSILFRIPKPIEESPKWSTESFTRELIISNHDH